MTPEDRQLLQDIHTCLVGNSLRGQRGLIDRVAIAENKIDTLEKVKSNKWDWSKVFKFLKFFKTVA